MSSSAIDLTLCCTCSAASAATPNDNIGPPRSWPLDTWLRSIGPCPLREPIAARKCAAQLLQRVRVCPFRCRAELSGYYASAGLDDPETAASLKNEGFNTAGELKDCELTKEDYKRPLCSSSPSTSPFLALFSLLSHLSLLYTSPLSPWRRRATKACSRLRWPGEAG